VWSSPAAANSPIASDNPANFAERYGNWALSPADALGGIGADAPTSRNPDRGQRSEIPNPERRLVNLASSASIDAPPPAPVSPPPPPGIFSGQPMQDYPMRPPIFVTDDRSLSDDDELIQRWRRWLDA
jgi:hypothetical protein